MLKQRKESLCQSQLARDHCFCSMQRASGVEPIEHYEISPVIAHKEYYILREIGELYLLINAAYLSS